MRALLTAGEGVTAHHVLESGLFDQKPEEKQVVFSWKIYYIVNDIGKLIANPVSKDSY